MSEDQSKVDEFLGNLATGEESPIPENLLQPTPKVEDKVDEVIEDKDEKLPYHKDPKVQRYIEKEIAKAMSSIKPEPTVSKETSNNDEKIDEVLTRIIGNDTPEKVSAISDFKQILLEREDRGAEKALGAIQAEQEAEKRAEAEAENKLLDGFDAIEDRFGIDLESSENKKMKGQFIEFIEKIAPKDSQGNIIELPDIEGAFDTFKSITSSSTTTSRAKDLASRSTERGSSNSVTPQVQDKSWNAVDRIFDKLTG